MNIFVTYVHRKDELERAFLMGRINGRRDLGRQRITELSLNTERRFFV